MADCVNFIYLDFHQIYVQVYNNDRNMSYATFFLTFEGLKFKDKNQINGK